jgi:hypothetical protein
MPTLLELIASTGVSAISRKSRADRSDRSGVFDVFITEENLLNNYRLVGISKRRRLRVLSGKDSRAATFAAYVITRRGALEANLDV